MKIFILILIFGSTCPVKITYNTAEACEKNKQIILSERASNYAAGDYTQTLDAYCVEGLKE